MLVEHVDFTAACALMKALPRPRSANTNVRILGHDGTVRLSATEPPTTMVVTIPGIHCDEVFNCSLRHLDQACTVLHGPRIQLVPAGDGLLLVDGRTQARLPAHGRPRPELPYTPITPSLRFELLHRQARSLLALGAVAGTDLAAPLFLDVLMTSGPDATRIHATDGRTISAHVSIDREPPGPDSDPGWCRVPAEALSALHKVLGSDVERVFVEGAQDARGDHVVRIVAEAGDVHAEVSTRGHPYPLPAPRRPHHDVRTANLTVGQVRELARAARELGRPGVSTSLATDPEVPVWHVQGTNPDGLVIVKSLTGASVPPSVVATTLADPVRFEHAVDAMSTSLGPCCPAVLSIDGTGVGSGLTVHAADTGVAWMVRMTGRRPLD